jgi:hypothetical protein
LPAPPMFVFLYLFRTHTNSEVTENVVFHDKLRHL